jgi:hypothetical protein
VGLPVAGGEPDFHCVFVPGENLDVGADDGFVNQTGQGRVTTCSITRSIPAAGYH